ncbi:MAG: ribonuclease H-like domain-containing protein [Calditrichia bacterium]
MNIKDKLSRLDKSPVIQKEETIQNPSDELWINDFQRELDAKIISDKNSFIVLKENFYPAYSHPVFEKLRDSGFVLGNFHRITADPAARQFNLRKALFIDLETTGLSGGTGTYAFLIGLGHFELDHIVVRQYVLPDFQHEWLMLNMVENILLSYEHLVSFNGKSFDIPLLRNRFILNRIDSMLDDKNHIDVLHASRRLWKRRLIYCDLQNLEYAILGQERHDDIPGEMIPQIYFEYIRKRKAGLLRDVLEHNYHDIVNMMLLTLQIGQISENPLQALEHSEDIFSLARFYYQNKEYSETVPLLEFLQQNNSDRPDRREALFLLSMTYKKMGDHRKAGDLFQQLLEEQHDHPEAIEELAKYYEHKEKNYAAALELVEQGLEYIELLKQLGRNNPLIDLRESLLHRKMRLQTKMENFKAENRGNPE